LAAAFAVAFAITAMDITRTLHPPGGATALIAVIGSDAIHDMGYLYVLLPAGLGAVILVVIAVLLNNLADDRHYPAFWFGGFAAPAVDGAGDLHLQAAKAAAALAIPAPLQLFRDQKPSNHIFGDVQIQRRGHPPPKVFIV
jgi:CBS-domain-containing membrane protein